MERGGPAVAGASDICWHDHWSRRQQPELEGAERAEPLWTAWPRQGMWPL